MVVRALTWNLFHGRDHPPDPALFTWRSRLLRTTETGNEYAQVNRPLLQEFAAAVANQEWDVALLQEAPPRWLGPVRRAAQASGASVLTSRNLGALARAAVAQLNPDLIASNEGGSNQLLVRRPWRIEKLMRLTLTLRPERRATLWARLRGPEDRELVVANLHASAAAPRAAGREVLAAAEGAIEWAAGAPLILGGDLNLRPAREPDVFEALERLGLRPPAGQDSLDHLLANGLEVVDPPQPLPDATREVPGPEGLRLRLSDHPMVAGTFGMK